MGLFRWLASYRSVDQPGPLLGGKNSWPRHGVLGSTSMLQ